MDINEFHKEVEQLLPVKRMTENFIDDLSNAFDSYHNILKSFVGK